MTKKCCRCKTEKVFPDEFTSKRVCNKCSGDGRGYLDSLKKAREKALLPPYQKYQDCYLRHRLKLYNLSEEAYADLKKSQENRCAICGNISERRLAIDHDHKTKKVRGLLCVNCNLGLGNFQDNPDFLAKAIEYLKRAQNG